MSTNITMYNDQELPSLSLAWTDATGALIDFSSGWTFTVKLSRTTAPATTLYVKTSGITGSNGSSGSNLVIDWSTTDWAGLEAAVNGTSYYVNVTARRTSDTKDRYFKPDSPITLKLKAAPGTSAVSPSSYPVTVDASTVTFTPSGSLVATNAQTAITEASTDLDAHINKTTGAHAASAISVLDTRGDYYATDVEGVLAELPTRFLLPKANTLVAIGDSIIANSANGNWHKVMVAMSGGRFSLLANSGVSGNTSTQMLARFTTDVVAYNPGWVLIQVTGNDQGNSITVAQAIANYKSMVALAVAAGIKPIIALGFPRDTTAVRDHVLNINAHMSWWCSNNGIACLDLYSPLVDVTDGTYAAAYTADGTHPNNVGSQVAGAAAAAQLPSWITRRADALATGANDPQNLAVNGLFLTDSNADGLSDSWAKAGTATVSRTAISAGLGNGYWQNIIPIDTSATAVYQDIVTVVGRVYELAFRVKCTTAQWRIRVPAYTTGNEDSPTASATAVMGDVTEAQGAIYVCRFTATSTSSRVQFQGQGAVGTVSYGQITVRDITSVAALG